MFVDLARSDLERGLAGHDVRHRLAINQVFEIPSVGGPALVRQLVSRWQINFKRIALTSMGRNTSVQLRVEGYHLFNTINLNNPNGNLSSSLFGRVTSARPSREIQLGARLTF